MSPKLSDRIIASASDLKDQLLAHPYSVELILKGEPPNAKRVLSKLHKMQCETSNAWTAMLQNGVKKSETAQEKALLEQLTPMNDVMQKRFETLFMEKFGSFDTTVSVDSITKNPLYKQLIDEASNAPILDLLVILLSTFYGVLAVANLKTDARYKPNWYYDLFVADYNQLEGLFSGMKALIDSKESKVSGDAESRLCDQFRRVVAQQITNLDALWN